LGGDDSQSETKLAPGAVLVEPVVESDEHLTELCKETLLPVTGMVRLSRRELEVIDHPAFQRLFEIYQLGQAHLVYRGATHMRASTQLERLRRRQSLPRRRVVTLRPER
jgi:hypothetical protein